MRRFELHNDAVLHDAQMCLNGLGCQASDLRGSLAADVLTVRAGLILAGQNRDDIAMDMPFEIWRDLGTFFLHFPTTQQVSPPT